MSNYHHGDLKQSLIYTARKQIDKKGAASLNLRALARAIGVTHPAVYRHFKDKDALLQELATEGFHELADKLEQACQQPSSTFTTKLKHIATAYIDFSLSEPELSRIMFGLIPAEQRLANEGLYAASKRCFTMLRSALLDKKGEDIQAVVAWALFHGLSQLTLERQVDMLEFPEQREQVIGRAVEVLARGLV